MGFQVVPATQTRLRELSEAGWLGPGDIDFVAGAGMSHIQNADLSRLQFDAVIPEGATPVSLYVPTPAGGDHIADLVAPYNKGNRFLRQIEANFLTAPSGATGTDHLRIDVAGATSGSQSLALSSDVAHHLWEGSDTDVLVDNTAGSTGSRTADAWIVRLTADADHTVKQVQCDALNNASTVQVRAVVLDTDRTEIVSRSDFITKAATSETIAFDLLEAVVWDQGTDLWFGFEVQEGENSECSQTRMNSAAYTNATGVTTREIQREDGDTLFSGGSHQGFWPKTTLRGSPGGVRLEGQVTVDLVTVGAGPTDPGSDLNLFLHFAEDAS